MPSPSPFWEIAVQERERKSNTSFPQIGGTGLHTQKKPRDACASYCSLPSYQTDSLCLGRMSVTAILDTWLAMGRGQWATAEPAVGPALQGYPLVRSPPPPTPPPPPTERTLFDKGNRWELVLCGVSGSHHGLGFSLNPNPKPYTMGPWLE